ncbi:MAG: BON domain-containing protein, partial [Gallionella sp.]
MRVLYLLLLILVCGLQQGCFPVIAAGVGSGVLMVQDRRSRDAFIEDQQIEVQALQRIEDQFNSEMHVNVTSYNHRVLISGEVLEDSTRSEISKIVSGLQNVRDVY